MLNTYEKSFSSGDRIEQLIHLESQKITAVLVDSPNCGELDVARHWA